MTHEKFANLHCAPAIGTDNYVELGLFIQPVCAPCRCNRIVIDMAHRACEARRPLTGEHDMIGFLHHLPRNDNRVFHALQSRNRADPRGVRDHHARIEFHEAVEIQYRAGSGVEDRIVFEHQRCGDGGIERTATAFKNPATRRDGRRGAANGVVIRAWTPASCAAVNDQGNGHMLLRKWVLQLYGPGKPS